MSVNELIKSLQSLSKSDREREVIMQTDAEGNGFSPLSDFTLGLYNPETDWSGELIVLDDEEDENYIKALFLEPTN